MTTSQNGQFSVEEYREREKKVDYICGRKFADYVAVKTTIKFLPQGLPRSITRRTADSRSTGADIETQQTRYDEIRAYQRALFAMPVDQLDKLYAAEQEQAMQEAMAKFEREEASRFYNLPTANADFSHWAKMAHWTLDEAIALSFGKDPGLVSLWTLKASGSGSRLLAEFSKMQTLTERAVQWQQLFDPVLPSLFITWMNENELPCPQELVDAVNKYSKKWPDWKKECEQLRDLHDSYARTAQDAARQAAEQAGALAQQEIGRREKALDEERSRLNQRIGELESQVQKQGSRWPWGSHETKLLRELADVTTRYWSMYDPEDYTTAPTNEQVIEWLVERGVAKRTAEAMATILRADNIPTGRRPQSY